MANLTRWDPFGEIERMDRTFSRMMRRAFTGWPPMFEGDGGTKLEWSPSADISETDKEYLIRAELPAVRKEDVKVTVEGGMLTVHLPKTETQKSKPKQITVQ